MGQCPVTPTPRTRRWYGWKLISRRHLTTTYPHLRIIVEPHTAEQHPEYPDLIVTNGDAGLLPLHTDLVITLGGDGTILHTSNLFGDGECPPVLSFSMGSLGFLLPFREPCMDLLAAGAEVMVIPA